MIKSICDFFEKTLDKNKFLLSVYNKYYEKPVRKEIQTSNIKATDKVLCIGGGAAPCTALQIYTQSKAKVYILDNDIEAVRTSRNLIADLKLEENIKVILGDGRYIDPNEYDLIHIALQVEPKEEVLNNIWTKLEDGKKVIIRKPKKFLSKFYSKIPKMYLEKNINRKDINISFTTMSSPIILEKI